MRFKKLANEIAKESKYTQQETEDFLKLCIKVMVRAVIRGEVLILNNFFSLKTDITNSGRGYHLSNGQKGQKKKKFVLKIRFASNLKKIIDAKKVY